MNYFDISYQKKVYVVKVCDIIDYLIIMQITVHKEKYSFFILEHFLKFNLEPNLHSINILKHY